MWAEAPLVQTASRTAEDVAESRKAASAVPTRWGYDVPVGAGASTARLECLLPNEPLVQTASRTVREVAETIRTTATKSSISENMIVESPTAAYIFESCRRRFAAYCCRRRLAAYC